MRLYNSYTSTNIYTSSTMALKWITTFCLITCGLCEGEDEWSDLESRTSLLTSDLNPLTSLSERYPNSQVIFNPYDTRYSLPQGPYPPDIPYYAAREYGLPGPGYVITDPYHSANNEQVNMGFSISSEPADEVPTEEEETSETIISTTTTPRPTKPPLPPPPPPPPPPLPPPFHSTNSINLSPPRQSHRLPKLPPKPQTSSHKGGHRKKPKKKLNKNNWNEPLELFPYNIESSSTEDEYKLVNRAVWVRDPNTQQHFYYEVNIPSFSAE